MTCVCCIFFGLGLVPCFLVKEVQGRNSKYSGCSIEPPVMRFLSSRSHYSDYFLEFLDLGSDSDESAGSIQSQD